MFQKAFGVAIAVCMSTLPAVADDLGEAAFGQYCATCHGASATGDGPLGELMTVNIPDLTQLAANNDGEFPMLKVIHTIDGRTGLRAHGGPMPVYGSLFKDDAMEAGTFASEVETRGRILSIAYYLEGLQG